jgi:UDP-N-acetylglucosamine 2-epimerase
MNQSYLILTDSGGIQEEVTALGRPALVLRTTTERMEGIDANVAKLVGVDEENIFAASSGLLSDKSMYNLMTRTTQLYGDGTSAAKILHIIQSHANELLSNVNNQKIGAASPIDEKSVPDKKPDKDFSVETKKYVWVLVLTVWHRQTLERHLNMLFTQKFSIAEKAHGPVMKVRQQTVRASKTVFACLCTFLTK